MKKTKCIISGIATAIMFTAFLSGCGNQETAKVTEKSSAPEGARLITGTEYTVNEMLYYSPDDSDSTILQSGIYYKIGEDGGIDILDALSEEVLESHSGDAECTEVDEDEWESLFTGGLTVDISNYDKKLQYDVSDNYRFFLMDNEVWLGTVKDGRLVSLFKMSENPIK